MTTATSSQSPTPTEQRTTYTYDSDGDIASQSITVGSQTDTTSYNYNSIGQLYCEVSPDANAAVGHLSCIRVTAGCRHHHLHLRR